MRSILLIVFLLILPSISHASNCPVTLNIDRVYAQPFLGQGDNFGEEGVNYDLSLMAIDEENPECEQYKDKKTFEMGRVDIFLPLISNLKKGQRLEGSLNYHRPSPFGKTLHEEYHNGFRIMKVFKGDKAVQDYSEEYIYFRHIGVFD